MVASTVSGNVSTGGWVPTAGGLQLVRADLRSVSIVGNVAARGSALVVFAGEVGLRGSVVSGVGSLCTLPWSSSVDSGGYNVVTDSTCGLSDPTDAVVAVALEPLADNGGPTRTHLPMVGSPLVDAIPFPTSGLCDATTGADQRGVPRPVGGGCDVGAVER